MKPPYLTVEAVWPRELEVGLGMVWGYSLEQHLLGRDLLLFYYWSTTGLSICNAFPAPCTRCSLPLRPKTSFAAVTEQRKCYQADYQSTFLLVLAVRSGRSGTFLIHRT
ncbi:hypothetical protein G7K_6124-t1 [Saitoella complicata NRRL Y-17804]|uniref:Uncharacterized protein n=1 Tax=Saitoella complicata (strain BCRC 22490 / CBS 7301 / JCM 7358 / NBRC 10748 / NRRL Y-17804) TaxID=698492 RepID=A0A0E9NQU0_SAICN|nr:hypothetical protein G7K_6124-t1 [Saitoella complicata NRRL Y-17804]